MKLISYIIVLFAIALVLSCGDGMSEFGEDARVIETYLDNELVNDRPHLKVLNTALSRDFMFYGAFIPMLNSPTGHSLKGRIVRFDVTADRLIMLESPKGHSIGDIKDSYILLAEFPIVRKDSDGVVIDFAKGMNTAFTMRNVHSRSVADRDTNTAEQFRAIFLSVSFVKSINTDQGVLTISQIAQWRNQKSELVSAEFRYYFREYLPASDYKKQTFGKSRWVQYFSTPPLIKPPTNNPFAYVTKWDITKPIVFHLSANTPAQYREAITDGLTFWNHFFGREVVVVRDLDKNLSAPHPLLNILQWVTWDNEASAYADMVVDHLTGQILQAQIYLRSGWVIESAKKLKNHLEELLIHEQQAETLPVVEDDVPLPSMFDMEDPCLKTMGGYDEIADLATHLSQNTIDNETLTLLTGDILRAVISHEMGHVLGLRHNLAASTTGTITLAERNALLKSYLKTGKYDLSHDKYFSHSIMDVFTAADDAIVGAQIRELMRSDDIKDSRLRKIYRYDQEAIDFGYFNKPMPGDTPFCTDDDIPVYIDCRRWDASNTAVLYSSERLHSMMTQIAIIMADTFINAIDPQRNGGPVRVADIPLTSKNVVKVVDLYVKELFLWFSKGSRSVLVESKLPAYGLQTVDLIADEKFKMVRTQVESNGVPQTLFGMLPPFRQSKLSAESVVEIFRAHFLVRLQEIMNAQPGFRLSDREFEQAVSIAKSFLHNLNNEIIGLILNVVTKAQFDDKNFQLPIEEAVGKIAHELILATVNNVDNNRLPQFRYDLKTRDLAAQILNPALGIIPDWSFTNLTKITNDLKQQMRRVGLADAPSGTNSIDIASLSREQRQWLIEQNRVLSTLVQMRSVSRKLHGP